jgi:hypothetical protein
MVIALFEEKYLRNKSMKWSRIVSHGQKRVHSGLSEKRGTLVGFEGF